MAEQIAARRERTALDRLGLTEKKQGLGVGGPTFLQRYRIALWEAVQSDVPCVPDLQPEMPEGKRPGQPLLRTCELEPALDEVAAIPGSEEVAAIPGSEDEVEPLGRPPRKTRKKWAKFRRVAKAGLGRRLWSTCVPFRQICSVTFTTTPSSLLPARGR